MVIATVEFVYHFSKGPINFIKIITGIRTDFIFCVKLSEFYLFIGQRFVMVFRDQSSDKLLFRDFIMLYF